MAAIRITSSAAQSAVLSNISIVHNSGAGDGIVIGGASRLVLSDFSITTPADAALVIDNASPTKVVINGGSLVAETGFLMTGAGPSTEGMIVSDLVIQATGVGMKLDGAFASRFSNIVIYDPGEHGVHVTDSFDNDFDDITIYRPGRDTDNTYDGVILDGNSDRNTLRGVHVVGNSVANQPRYGINVSAATCNDTVYVGCRTGLAANYGTGAYNDAGTGTVNTYPGAAGAQGDNFL